MSSVGAVRVEDLTTRARIRDAAIAYFGSHGFTSATVRVIAAAAGVSPALVIHHFGSKDGLRAVCDEHVLARIDEATEAAATHLDASDVLDRIAGRPDMATLAPYLLTALSEGGAFGERIFRRLVDDTERYLRAAVTAGVARPTTDERGRAEALVTFKLGLLSYGRYLVPGDAPPDELMLRVAARLTAPALELFTHGMFTTSDYLDAYRAQQRTQGAPGHPGSPAEEGGAA